jgi:hypothetical protein
VIGLAVCGAVCCSDFGTSAHATHVRTQAIEDNLVAVLKRHTPRDYEVLSFLERVVRSQARLNGQHPSRELLVNLIHAAFGPSDSLIPDEVIDMDILLAGLYHYRGDDATPEQRLAGDW